MGGALCCARTHEAPRTPEMVITAMVAVSKILRANFGGAAPRRALRMKAPVRGQLENLAAFRRRAVAVGSSSSRDPTITAIRPNLPDLIAPRQRHPGPLSSGGLR